MNKFDELEAMLSVHVNLSYICITESWLNVTIPDSLVSLQDFDIYRMDRCDRLGGGVCIYVKNIFSVRRLYPSPHPDYFESVWLVNLSLKHIVVTFYIPPLVSLSKSMNTEIEEFVVKNVDQFLLTYIDFDIFLTDDFNNLDVSNLCRLLNLIDVVTDPTRGKNILDRVLISKVLSDTYTCIVGPPIGNSDHNCVYFHGTRFCYDKQSHPVLFHSYDNASICLFIEKLSSVNFSILYGLENVDDKAMFLQDALDYALTALPTKIVYFSKKDKPWITASLKVLITERWKAFRDRNWPRFESLKQKVRNQIKLAKQHWVEQSSSSTKGMWKTVNYITKNANRSIPFSSINVPLSELVDDINKRLASNFSPQCKDFDKFQEYIKSLDDFLWMPLIDVSWTYKKLSKLDKSKSPGSDMMSPKLYVAAAHLLAAPITHIVNCSIISRQVPILWKIGHVIPLPKTSRPSLDSLRPITLLSVPAKIMEKAILEDLKPKLLSLVSHDQFGFKPKSSTACAIIKLHNEITLSLDQKSTKGVSVLFFDLAKAFDVLPHRRLLEKLLYRSTFYGGSIPLGFISWLSSYFSDRLQTVRVGSHFSNFLSVTSGVPQGSHLGPLLFIVYMDDLNLPPRYQHSTILKYADDTAVMVTIKTDFREVKAIVQYVQEWCRTNEMKLNIDKSKHLFINKSVPVESLSDIPIGISESVNYLGVIMNSSCTWSGHINKIVKTASSRIHGLRILRNSLTKRQLLLLYNATIRSIIDYASPVFCGVSANELHPLSVIQNRCHNIICGKHCQCSEFPPIQDRITSLSSKFFNLVLLDSSHSLHHLLFERLPSGRFRIPPCRTTRRLKCFIYKCMLLFNERYTR